MYDIMHRIAEKEEHLAMEEEGKLLINILHQHALEKYDPIHKDHTLNWRRYNMEPINLWRPPPTKRKNESRK